ncbi:hypothetical protein ANO11243_067370 [Dothideomycetidae sp. 11243]|nr:hypothetical protein ANO11243_067370 [fungal sp. No.11243]
MMASTTVIEVVPRYALSSAVDFFVRRFEPRQGETRVESSRGHSSIRNALVQSAVPNAQHVGGVAHRRRAGNDIETLLSVLGLLLCWEVWRPIVCLPVFHHQRYRHIISVVAEGWSLRAPLFVFEIWEPPCPWSDPPSNPIMLWVSVSSCLRLSKTLSALGRKRERAFEAILGPQKKKEDDCSPPGRSEED